MSLGQVVQAAEQGPDLEILRQGLEAADLRADGARAGLLPRVQVEGNILRWDDPIEFTLPIAPEPIVVREQVTSQIGVTAIQPLTSIYPLYHAQRAQRLGARVEHEEYGTRTLDIEHGAAGLYLQLLAAKSYRTIAEARVKTLEAQAKRLADLASGGLAQRADVMRLEAAAAMARQQAISARVAETVLGGELALLLGLPANTRVQAADELPATPTLPTPTPVSAAARPEWRAARIRAEQARAGSKAAFGALLPQVAAVGNITHNEGNGSLGAEDSWYIGLSATWTVWDWKATYNGWKAADAQARQAELAARRVSQRNALEADTRMRQAQAAHEALAAAKVGLAAAEEAYRIQEARFSEGAATTTDLLAAEEQVIEARFGSASARYAFYGALLGIERAQGQKPGLSFLGGTK